jgi:HlyD family secretion protein
MDVPRKSANRKRRIRQIAYAVVGLAVILVVTVGVSRLKPAAPSADGGALWTDTVKRGSMLRQVRGLGTLVPLEIRWIPALSDGRVERVVVQPGANVKADSVLIVLSNPELEQQTLDAETQLKGAEAEYVSLKKRLDNDLLNQKAAAATVQADYSTAKLQAEVNDDLYQKGLSAELNAKLSKVRAEELAIRNQIEQQRLDSSSESVRAQLAVQQARVEQMRALLELRRKQLSQLQVRAGIDGVLQEMLVQVGQQVTPGSNLARVADPARLKAELRIAETQTRDLAIGLPVSVDTRNGIIPGRVMRMDPGATNGTVTVDVSLEGELPKGARPNLSVDGTIELERLDDILYMGRPVHGQENGQIGLFKVDPDGKTATRVKVLLGRSSVNTIEILDGLKEGDKVVLSDTSQFDNTDRIAIK